MHANSNVKKAICIKLSNLNCTIVFFAIRSSKQDHTILYLQIFSKKIILKIVSANVINILTTQKNKKQTNNNVPRIKH